MTTGRLPKHRGDHRRARWLAPIPRDRRPRRFGQLLLGLLLYGVTMALMVRSVLGLDPWDVFHQGLTRLLARAGSPLSYGTVITGVSVLVLLLWIPLRQRPGLGTVANAAIIGWTTDLTLAVVPAPHAWAARIAVLVLAVLGNALAGALYLGAGLGPGPRDGLMTGLVARAARSRAAGGRAARWPAWIGSVRVVRTAIELGVLAVGWLLGGLVGVGTVVYALAIGPLLHVLLPRLQVGAGPIRSNRDPARTGGSARPTH